MDLDRLRDLVAGIPNGHWMSYGDLAAASGGNERHARAHQQRQHRSARRPTSLSDQSLHNHQPPVHPCAGS